MKALGKIFILITMIISMIFIVACEKQEVVQEKVEYVTEKDLKPIDKKYVIKILEAEYGKELVIEEDSIEIEDGMYVVEVFIEFMDDEPHGGHTTPHMHKQSMGTHKIDMYLGTIID